MYSSSILVVFLVIVVVVFFFKQKTAYEMRISDWSSDVCSSDLGPMSTTSSSTPVESFTRCCSKSPIIEWLHWFLFETNLAGIVAAGKRQQIGGRVRRR